MMQFGEFMSGKIASKQCSQEKEAGGGGAHLKVISAPQVAFEIINHLQKGLSSLNDKTIGL
jgi:hypothetical protein